MKNLLGILVATIVAMVFAVSFSAAIQAVEPVTFPQRPSTGWVSDCKIVRAIDGDTIIVEVTQTMRVRLLDCWAPESRTKDLDEKARGLASKHNMETLIKPGDKAVLSVPLTGSLDDSLTLGRVLGYIWRDGDDVSLNQRQVDGGFATRMK